MSRTHIFTMTVTALLCAVGIVIPMFSPVKIVIPPASFTLGSHVAIMIAMFISPGVALAVSLGTTLGFFLGGFPLVIVLRALSQVVFAVGGAYFLKFRPEVLNSVFRMTVFSFIIGLVHAAFELAVVAAFYLGGNISSVFYESGFVRSVLLLVGLGTVVHGMVDFGISAVIWKALRLNGLTIKKA